MTICDTDLDFAEADLERAQRHLLSVITSLDRRVVHRAFVDADRAWAMVRVLRPRRQATAVK